MSTHNTPASNDFVLDGLLPCPFCGAEAKRFTIGEEEPNNAGGDVIVCTRCQASSHVEFGRKENLVSLWNARVAAAPASPEPASNEAPGRGGVDEDAARELFRSHCQPGDRGTLERYGENAAVSAIMAVVRTTRTPSADLIEELVSALEDLNNHIGDDMVDSRAKRIAELRVLAARKGAAK